MAVRTNDARATEQTLQRVLQVLNLLSSSGSTESLEEISTSSAALLAAIEGTLDVEVQNFPSDFPDAAVLDAIQNLQLAGGARKDEENSTFVALDDGETFTGEWASTDGVGAISFFGYSTGSNLTTARLEWSTDGVNVDTDLLSTTDYQASEDTSTPGFWIYYPDPQTYLLRGYYRLVLENNSGTNQTLLSAETWLFPSGANPFAFGGLTGSLGTLSKALLTRSVQAGTAPDGTFTNLAADGIVAFDTAELSGSFPSGSTPAFDAVGPIVAANVQDTGWLPSEEWNYQSFFGNFDISGCKIFLMDASDDQGNNSVTTSFSFPTALSVGGFSTVNVGAPNFQRYFRVVIINDTGSTSNNWAWQSKLQSVEPGSVFLSLDQPIFDFFPAPITQAIIKGQSPTGDYEAVRVGGTTPLSPTPSALGISGVYLSDAIDCEKYPTTLFLITADQASADGGVEVEWSDTEAFTVVRSVVTRSFNTGNISPGLLLPLRNRARYMRIRFTNGLTAQGRFFINLTSSPTPLAQEVGLVSSAAGATGQQDVDLTASKIASSPLVGRKSLRLRNLSSSARALYYGFGAGTSVTNGDELSEGESVDLDVDEFVEVYVITTSTGGAGVRCAWTELA